MKTKHFNLLRRLEAALSIERLDMVLPHEEMEGCIDLKEAFPDSDPCAWMFFGPMGAWPKVAVNERGDIIKICDRSGGSRWAIEGPIYKAILDNLCKLIRDGVHIGRLIIDPEFNQAIGKHLMQHFDWSMPALGPYVFDGYVFDNIFPKDQKEKDGNLFRCFENAFNKLKDILYRFYRSGIVTEEGSILSKEGWKRFAREFVRTLIDCVVDIIREGIPA